MEMNSKELGNLLVDENYISQEDFDSAQEFIQEHDISFAQYLLEKEIITKDLLGQAIAEDYGIPYADLNSNPPSEEVLEKIPQEKAREFDATVYSLEEDKAVIATSKPNNLRLRGIFREIFPDRELDLAYALPEDLQELFLHYETELSDELEQMFNSQTASANVIFDAIVKDALVKKTSDIHFEPDEEEVSVRFRINGKLKRVATFPRKYYTKILNYIKIQSDLPIDEHARPQGGSIRYDKRDVDMRISIVPTVEGQKVAIRLLAEYMKDFTLSNLGLKSSDRSTLRRAAKNPFGMFLVSGPTGSGKTTTLYSLIKLLNEVDVNITTIEDPVEYRLKGTNQIQVNEQIDLTFARGLRTIVRQDPDIILVGEIRDEETSQIAVNAALTGHLLFSTFHANDAATTIPRLLNMGVEPYLLASTLEVVVSQRLARTICQKCRESRDITKKEISKKYGEEVADSFKKDKMTVYSGDGCNLCNQTGYKGRTGIFEIIDIDSKLEELILENPSKREIWEVAREQGADSLFEDGMAKLERGQTTLEELTRVASPYKY